MRLNHPEALLLPFPRACGKLSSVKPVPGAKKVGHHCSRTLCSKSTLCLPRLLCGPRAACFQWRSPRGTESAPHARADSGWQEAGISVEFLLFCPPKELSSKTHSHTPHPPPTATLL